MLCGDYQVEYLTLDFGGGATINGDTIRGANGVQLLVSVLLGLGLSDVILLR